jgi:hypothetical protein
VTEGIVATELKSELGRWKCGLSVNDFGTLIEIVTEEWDELLI